MISPAGGMDTVRGLKEVGDVFRTQSNRPNAGKYMILVTDGRSGTFQQTMQVLNTYTCLLLHLMYVFIFLVKWTPVGK